MTRPPRVFISHTTVGLKALAERVAEVLRQRGIKPIIQTGFHPSAHDVKGMLAGPQNLMGRKERKNSKREGSGGSAFFAFFRFFRPTQLKQAIEAIQFEITVLAGKPTNLPYTSFGTPFNGRDEFLAELRQHLTAEGPVVSRPDHPVSKGFRRCGAWSLRVPQNEAAVLKVDTARGLRGSERPMIVLDEVLPKRVLGSTGKRTIHGMGGVGKTRAAIEYAWKHAGDYRALIFISADTPEALHRNLAAS